MIQQKVGPNLQENLQNGIMAFEKAAQAGADCVVFPELAFTPFYPQKPSEENNLKLAESIPGPTTDAFCELAEKHGIVVVLNLFEKVGGKTYDSSPVIDRDGSLLGITRMAHIMEGPCFHEQGYYSPGENVNLVYSTGCGKLGVAICYDRHFPEYMRTLALQGAELVVVPQAGAVGEWPEGLFEAEMRVAAFQNGYFAALCNRVGKEEFLEFAGGSFVAGPDGQILKQASLGENAILSVDLDLKEISHCSAHKHFLPDRRPDLYSRWE